MLFGASSRLPLMALSVRNTIGRFLSSTFIGSPMPVYTDAQRATARAIFDFWKSVGGSDLDAAAWVGNCEGETSFVIHAIGDGGKAAGLAQHHKARRDLILANAGIDMATASVTAQCKGIYAECTGKWSAYKRVWDMVRAEPTLEGKVRVRVTKFEQSAMPDRDVARRTKLAEYWIGEFGGAKATPVATAAPPAPAKAATVSIVPVAAPAASKPPELPAKAQRLVLPTLKSKPSPNVSVRTAKIDLIVLHDCEGSYPGAVAWFADKRSGVSAHLVLKEDGTEATQMVPFDKKAWHAKAFNSRSIGVEMGGFSDRGFPEVEWQALANVTAYLCRKFSVPVHWSKTGKEPGFCRHYDLGQAGGGHHDPTTNDKVWLHFVSLVEAASKLDIPADWQTTAQARLIVA